MPVDRKGNWRIAQDTEVEGVMRVLPDVVAAEDQVFAKGLLEAGVKLVAEARLQRAGHSRAAIQEWIQHRIQTTCAGKDQILVERRLQSSRIRNAKHRAAGLDLVRHTDARLGLL